ncbi:MAG: YaeQ family protein [Gammaproteobacteria bacterium]|nr:YaeQ family protein [Gammaproteobacteria bacterium]
MALGATVYKAELQISDMDRNYYHTHALTIAQHPSETNERMMIRVLAFALYANERLSFGRGLSTQDEPDLWRKDLTGKIELWIDVGQPDEQRIRKACGRADEVVVITYSGRNSATWWTKIAPGLARLRNLTLLNVDTTSSEALAALASRTMQLQCLIQDGAIQFITGDRLVAIEIAAVEVGIGDA